ncbi:immunoglobulin superfamily member 6 isoform X2 [Mixophyes fleayi]|uniref:immunoglobulin superfamily member 6 isoform X2 n=1 Tax=Mixophyes fleayi TaxID=3061075 RepID=UPI003F4DE725
METPGLRRFIVFTSILLHYQYGVRSCMVTVQQNDFYETEISSKSVSLTCQYKAKTCPGRAEVYWFRYLASEQEQLYPNSNQRFKADNNDTHTVLYIRNISVQDSGIYVCGIAFKGSSDSTSKTTGPGTTLLIRDVYQTVITPANTSLIVICTLLFIYSITVFSYYAFRSKWKICKFTENKRGFTGETDKSYRARSIFQAIAKEYRNRYERKTNKQNLVIEDDTIYQNT